MHKLNIVLPTATVLLLFAFTQESAPLFAQGFDNYVKPQTGSEPAVVQNQVAAPVQQANVQNVQSNLTAPSASANVAAQGGYLANREAVSAIVDPPAEYRPTQEELALLDRCASLIRQTIAVPCTGCRYCVEANHCPMGIPIPNYFALYNTEKMRKREDFSPEKEYYANWVKQDYGRASACISCRGCERVCPQHIHISERLKEVAQTLEEGNDHL